MLEIVGKVLKPQGVKGEIKILPLLSDCEDFAYLKNLEIKKISYKIQSCRVHQGYAYVKLQNIDNRDSVENFRDEFVYANRDELPKLDEGQFYISDLIDCYLLDENNQKLGFIQDVLNYGASDILQIRQGSEEILCPYLKELFLQTDLENKKIWVDTKKFKELTESED